jgi:hypothetical protein
MEISEAQKARVLNPATAPKNGEPRSERESLLLLFRNRLNADRKAARFPQLSDKRVAKMFERYPTERLHLLFRECSDAEKFGGLLKFKLEEYRTKV